MAILCEDCKNFKRTLRPADLQGMCSDTAGPSNILSCWAFSRKRAPGAFTAPKDCKYFQEKKKVG